MAIKLILYVLRNISENLYKLLQKGKYNYRSNAFAKEKEACSIKC